MRSSSMAQCPAVRHRLPHPSIKAYLSSRKRTHPCRASDRSPPPPRATLAGRGDVAAPQSQTRLAASDVASLDKAKAAGADVGRSRNDPGPDDGQEWQLLVALSAAVAVICSVDRAAMSVAILPMSMQFLWDDSTKGLIGSAFFLGYMVTNLCGGYLATRWQPKTVLSLGVTIWSIFTLATPLAAATDNLPALLLCRVAMGMGEGVTFPSISNLVASNVPPSSKSRSLSLIYSGVQMGTIISLVTAPAIISNFDWPSVFYIFGATGFVWLAVWLPLGRDVAHESYQNPGAQARSALASSWADFVNWFPLGPEPAAIDDSSYARSDKSGRGSALPSSRDAAPLEANPDGSAAAGAGKPFSMRDLPWEAIAVNRPFWAIFISHAAWGFGHYVCLSWLPSYYFQEYGLDVRESAWLSALPWVATVCVTNFGGWLSDGLVNKGAVSRGNARKLLQGAAMFGPSACLLYLAAAATHAVPPLSLSSAVALMTATLALGGFTGAGFASNHQDLTTRYTGILFGFTNAASSLSGSMSTYATGRILDTTHSWALVFEIVAIVYIGSGLLYAAWASADNQFDELPADSAPARK